MLGTLQTPMAPPSASSSSRWRRFALSAAFLCAAFFLLVSLVPPLPPPALSLDAPACRWVPTIEVCSHQLRGSSAPSGSLDAMTALSTKYNDDPTTASRAFDVSRDGFVIAGGGGIIVLEELEHAKARHCLRIHTQTLLALPHFGPAPSQRRVAPRYTASWSGTRPTRTGTTWWRRRGSAARTACGWR